MTTEVTLYDSREYGEETIVTLSRVERIGTRLTVSYLNSESVVNFYLQVRENFQAIYKTSKA